MQNFFNTVIRNLNFTGTIIIFIVMVVVISIMLLFSSPLKKNKMFIVQKDVTGHQVANQLKDENIIYSKTLFLLYLKITGKTKNIIPGEFLIPASTSFISVIEYISDSKNIYSYKITLVDGYTVKQFLEIIEKTPNLSGNIYPVEEGSMMPDTYYFIKNDTKESIIARSKTAMEQYLDKLWQTRSSNLPYKNKKEALIMASMVEKETGTPSERELIAGLFVNRLKIGMKLQSDPTVAYGLGKENADKLTKNDLKTPHPYNTYTKYGLPVGPIANPSRESLYAVFFPSKTPYLYFVANGKGGHVFTTNLKDHNKEVTKWRKIEQEIRKKDNN